MSPSKYNLERGGRGAKRERMVSWCQRVVSSLTNTARRNHSTSVFEYTNASIGQF